MPTLVGLRPTGDPPDTDASDRPGPSATEVDPRIRARREEIRRDRRRRRRRTLVTAAVVVGLVAAAFGLTRTAALDVDHLDVQGAARVSEDEVLRASGLRTGQRLVDVDPAAVRAAVEALPWVATAEVDRRWTGTVAITVTERVPAALLADGKGGWLAVDDGGRVLAAVPDADPSAVVHLDGVPAVPPGSTADPRVTTGIEVARALTPAERSRVRVVHLTDRGTVDLHLRPRGVVWLGHPDDALVGKVQSLQTVLGKVDLRCVQTIDVRVPQQPVLTREPACT